jgi:hypothetical protein
MTDNPRRLEAGSGCLGLGLLTSLSPLIARSLAVERSARPASAADLVRQLEEALA